MSGQIIGPIGVLPASVVSLSIDGQGHGNTSASATTPVTISTTKSNDVIIVSILSNGGLVTSVVGSTLGAFTFRAKDALAGGLETWWAVASSPVTSEVITVTPNIPNQFVTIDALAINGAKTSAPFDVNGSLPSVINPGPADPVVVSTTAANTIILGSFRMGSASTPTAGTGFTAVNGSGADFCIFEYKIVSAAQTSLNVTLTTGAGDSNGSIGDAIVQGP